MIIYLAQPIDQADEDRLGPVWATMVNNHLADDGYHIYRPARAWRVDPSRPDPAIEAINRYALDWADCVVALLPAGVPTIGAPMEIEAALHKGIPVVVLGGRGSFALEGRPGIYRAADPSEVSPLVRKAVAEANARRVDAAHAKTVNVKGSPMPVVGHRLPTRTHDDDAGFDLYVSADTTCPVGQITYVPCDTRVQLPGWSWALILGRSSTLRKRNMLTQPAVIDAGWRGQLEVAVYNIGPTAQVVAAGDRIGQLVIMQNHTRSVTPVQADTLDDHPRGENGWGSSGA